MDGEPEMGRMQDQIVPSDLDRLGGELLHCFVGPADRVLLELRVGDVLVAPRHRHHVGALTRLKVPPVLRYGGDRHVGLGAEDGLEGEAPFRVRIRLFFLEEEHAGVDEPRLRVLERGGVRGEEQGDLVLDRNGEGIHFGVAPPGSPLISRSRGEGHRPAPRGPVRFGLADRLTGHSRRAIGGHVAARGESPCPAHQHPYPHAERLVVGESAYAALPGIHGLGAIQADPGVGVLGAARFRGVQRSHEQLGDGRVDRRGLPRGEPGGGFGGVGLAGGRQDQARGRSGGCGAQELSATG